jgi:Ca2+-binding EF-hand superfamily protein
MSLRNRIPALTIFTLVACLLGSALALAEPAAKPDGHGRHGGLFARLDANGDGKIDRAEARTAATAHFAKMDKNGDGAISKEEKMAPPAQGQGGKKDERSARKEERFLKLDTNKNGKVEKAEALAHADQLFVDLDANKDGQVTRDEAKASMAAKHHGKRERGHDCHDGGTKTRDGSPKATAKGQAI